MNFLRLFLRVLETRLNIALLRSFLTSEATFSLVRLFLKIAFKDSLVFCRKAFGPDLDVQQSPLALPPAPTHPGDPPPLLGFSI